MIEVYVVLSLAAFGYLLNSLNINVKPSKLQINKFEVPNNTNVYESNYTMKAQETERHVAAKAYKEALTPKRTNRVMTMSGEMVDKDNFTHNNMEPYFGGRIRQNMGEDTNRAVLENFTGVSDLKKNKCEVKSFYDQTKDSGNVYGVENRSDFYRDRITQPYLRNNEVPIEQVRVGPGLNQGFTATPTGGFQQYDDGEIARSSEKCVDQLRAANKPKTTFAARKVDGLKTGLRGEVGKVNKNRVERFYEQTPEMYLKTTGANLKQAQQPKFEVKPTNRFDTSKEYMGAVMGRKKRKADEGVKATARQQLETTGIRNAVLNAFGMGDKTDHGRKGIVVYNNERELYTENTYQGGLTSMIKAIVAPIQDLIKVSKKQEGVDNPRPYGSLNPQLPNKMTIGPDDKMRTTIKEQFSDANELANLKGAERTSQYYDDNAKGTIKETTEDSADNANLKGAQRTSQYFEDKAKSAREGLEEEELQVANLCGATKVQIFDINDLARTCIKETLIHNDTAGNLKGPVELYVYNAEDWEAKVTGRNTLENEEYHANMSSFKKGELQYDDEARVTTKQTTLITDYEGHVNLETKGTYDDNFIAKETQKSFISNNDYIAGAGRDKGEGYAVTEYSAKDVQKQFISDNDYVGGAESANFKKDMDISDYLNAHIDERKEVLLTGRDPTKSGVKSFNNSVSVRIVKPECDIKAIREKNNMNRIYQNLPVQSDKQFTKQRLAVDVSSKIGFDRIDPDLLSAYRNNPYTQRLDSVN